MTSCPKLDAWHVVTTRDPLLDSDDEHGNEYDRRDYGMWSLIKSILSSDIIPNVDFTVQRLKIVTHLSRQRWYEHKSDSFPDKYGLPSEWET